MAKVCLVLLISSLAAAAARAQSPDGVKWASRVVSEKDTVTNLQFYFHDILGGSNPTAVRVAQSANTDQSPTNFGAITMVDNPLTQGPDPNSKLVGRAQGLYGSAGQSELSLIMAMSLAFTDGIYKGSSITLFGRNPAMNPSREMPIVGGTGVFRLARGYAIANTYSVDPTATVVGYNVTVSVDSSAGGGNNTNTRTVDFNLSATVISTLINHLTVAIFTVITLYCCH